jgi:uncharacterized protein
MSTVSTPLSLYQSIIHDPFWSKYVQLARGTVIPYQWEALNDRIADAAPSHAIRNFRIAAGMEKGEFGGMVFQDSDVAKWLEAVGYSLALSPDQELEKLADETIDIIAAAQLDDGYLNTYYTIEEPGQRWTNLHECHELYCAGHMIEAAVAYYEATGKRKLLDVMCRFADHIDSVFGPDPDKLRGYDGHQEIELALIKLWKVTGEDRYLRLSEFFINERGQQPLFLVEEWKQRGGYSYWRKGIIPQPGMEYNQAHLPVREQEVAVGHAVRAVYMYTAMADLALHLKDEKLMKACRRLWSNIVSKQMYITGGIGSTYLGEAFTFDYDLPNDTVYAETCASIGLIFFASRILQIEENREYADVLERALFNTVISGMSLDGKSYFYVNPLEVWPEACEHNPGKHHVKPVRQKWFGCSCCPPNVARLLTSLGQYVYTANDHTLYAHLYIGGSATCTLSGNSVTVHQQTQYPWDGAVSFTIQTEADAAEFTLALRIPGWCEKAALFVNGESVPIDDISSNGYAKLTRPWRTGDRVELNLSMTPELVVSNPKLRYNAGKAAIVRGPLVYALEEVDHGAPLSSIQLKPDSEWTAAWDPDLFGGTMVVQGEGELEISDEDSLYRPLSTRTARPISIRAIPYAYWGNRKPGEMAVWNRVK